MARTVQLEPAYLLAVRPYGDSSLLLEAFTAAQGRVGLVARGARAPRSRLRGVLQPFAPLLLSWRAAGELGTLTGAEAQAPPVVLSGERVFFGWYLNELIMRLLQRQDAHPHLHAIYAALLPELAGSDVQAEIALRLFEKHLLADIGYGLHLDADLDAGMRYRYDWERGPVADAQGYAGSSLIALRDDRLDDDASRRDARQLLREAIRRQLGGRELQTAALLRQMRRS